MILRKLLLIFSLLFYFQSYAQLKPAKIFYDNMILQHGVEIPVWGKASAGETVQVRLDSIITVGTANEKGEWKIMLPPQEAGGPLQLVISGKLDTLLFQNVLVGDVWLASGQSNMEHPIKGWEWIPHSEVNNFKEELKDASYPQIRLFNVPKFPSPLPISDLTSGKWKIADSSTVAPFSSTAWFSANGGSFEQPLQITMYPGTTEGEIRYTIDGSHPNEKSNLYTNPIEIDRFMFIQAACFSKNRPNSYARQAIFDVYDTGVNGLNYEYYVGDNWKVLPDFDRLEPMKSGITLDLDISKINERNDYWGIKFDGKLKINNGGEYTLYIASDDGSRLFIDGNMLIDHDGIHPETERSAQLYLEKGMHKIKLHYFQASLGFGLALMIKGPGIVKQKFPISMFHRA